MRLIHRTAVIMAVGMLLVPQLAAASEIEEKLRVMEERMAQMEDRLEAATDQLSEADATVRSQQDVIESAGLTEERGSANALSSFIEKTDINAWAAVSYNYNSNGSNNAAMGAGQNGFVGHGSPNTFQLDQVWIEIDKAPTEESRGGFHVDFSAGQATDNVNPTLATGDEAMTVGLYSAYVSYLAPLGKDVQIDAGQLPTLLGAEVTQTNANFNITRGRVWGIQPTTGLGAVASSEIIDGLSIAVGALNSPISNERAANVNAGSIGGVDSRKGKALTSQVAYRTDNYSAAVGVNYGTDGPTGAAGAAALANKTTLVDVLLTARPTDNLDTWINYDYKKMNNTGPNVNQHGIALAARLAVLDSTGVAVRGEYLITKTTGAAKAKALTLTGTLDHALTDNLSAKAEIRWDRTGPNALLNKNLLVTQESQVVGLVQLLYQF